MEFLAGEPLSRVIRRGPLEPARAVRIARDICSSLQEAHGKGIVHRDLKPDNIILVQEDGEEVAKVLDFGIAKMVAGEEDRPLTRTGVVCGTPAYMSPEQGSGKPVGPASDLYSLGVLLFEMLTGKPPFEAATPVMVVMKHISEPPPPIAEAAPVPLPVPLRRLVTGLLAKEVRDRPGSAREVGEELDRVRTATDNPTAVWDEPAPAVAATVELPASEIPTEPMRDRVARGREGTADAESIMGRAGRSLLLRAGIAAGFVALAGGAIYQFSPWSGAPPVAEKPSALGATGQGTEVASAPADTTSGDAGGAVRQVEDVPKLLPSKGLDAASPGFAEVVTGETPPSLQPNVVPGASHVVAREVAPPPGARAEAAEATVDVIAQDIRFLLVDSTGQGVPDVSVESAREVRTGDVSTEAVRAARTSGADAGAVKKGHSKAAAHEGGARLPEDPAGGQDGRTNAERAGEVEALLGKAAAAMDEKRWKVAYEYLKKARSLSDDPASVERTIQQCRERKAKEDPFDEGDLF